MIGKDVPFALLQAIAELAEDELRGALARLQAAEFLYETQPLPGPRVHLQARAHPRGGLRQPAPGAAPRASTREIVEAIERLYPDRLGEHVERLGSSRLPGRAVGDGRRLPPAGRAQGGLALGVPGGRGGLRAGAGGGPAPPRDPRDAGAGDRPAARPARAPAGAVADEPRPRARPGGRSRRPSARRRATAGAGLVVAGQHPLDYRAITPRRSRRPCAPWTSVSGSAILPRTPPPSLRLGAIHHTIGRIRQGGRLPPARRGA